MPIEELLKNLPPEILEKPASLDEKPGDESGDDADDEAEDKVRNKRGECTVRPPSCMTRRSRSRKCCIQKMESVVCRLESSDSIAGKIKGFVRKYASTSCVNQALFEATPLANSFRHTNECTCVRTPERDLGIELNLCPLCPVLAFANVGCFASADHGAEFTLRIAFWSAFLQQGQHSLRCPPPLRGMRFLQRAKHHAAEPNPCTV